MFPIILISKLIVVCHVEVESINFASC